MKTLLTLFAIILSLGLANAQTKKPVAKNTEIPTKTETPSATKGPTKEETIEYIANTLNAKEIHFIVFPELKKSGGISPKTVEKYFVESILMDNCKLIIHLKIESNESYSDFKWYKSETIVYSDQIVEIPLDKIEFIKEGSITYPEYNLTSNFILFKAVQDSKLIKENSKWFSKYKESGKIDYEKQKEDLLSEYKFNANQINEVKLTKAFNHLRKLCGAPEPISFD